MKKRKMPKAFYADAKWILTFPTGSDWLTGAFRPNRERELVEAGVLVPVPGKPGMFTVGALKPEYAAE